MMRFLRVRDGSENPFFVMLGHPELVEGDEAWQKKIAADSLTPMQQNKAKDEP